MIFPKQTNFCPECGTPVPNHTDICSFWEWKKNLFKTVYDRTYGDDKECICGHEYYRHFDWAADYFNSCKYCDCFDFKELSDEKYHFSFYNWDLYKKNGEPQIGCCQAEDIKEAGIIFFKIFNKLPEFHQIHFETWCRICYPEIPTAEES